MFNDKYKIFILSSERSGTNLLQKLLSNHSKISGPKTPQLINTFQSHERFYGDLSKLENKNFLINDLLQICNHAFSKWDLEVDNSKIDLITEKKFIEAIIWLYLQKSIQDGKQGFVAKELNAHLFLNEIIQVHPNSKFIHLVRNPLEQAASWMKTPLFYSNPEVVVKDWYNTQNIILNKKNQYPNHIITCRYEDLVNNTTKEMTRILEFCNLEIDENCFQNNKVRENDNWNELWKNVNKEVGNNLSKHEEELNKYEIDIIKTIAYPIAKELNYFDKNPNFSFNKKYKFKKVLRNLKSRKKRRKVQGSKLTSERIIFANTIKKNIIKQYFNV
jgi:hypothetical protein